MLRLSQVILFSINLAITIGCTYLALNSKNKLHVVIFLGAAMFNLSLAFIHLFILPHCGSFFKEV
jgi:hypothetical protein